MKGRSPTRLPTFEDPLDARVYRRLGLLGPGPAAFYADAVRLMSEERPLFSTTHVVGHLLREIESALRAVLFLLDDSSSSDEVEECSHKSP